jgi:hypothetical protein
MDGISGWMDGWMGDAGKLADILLSRPLETLPAGWIDQQSRAQGSRSGSPAETTEREAGGSSGSPEGA